MNPRLLVVTPTFHDYWRSIADAFGRLGHDVTVCRYDDHGGLHGRLRHKVRSELPQQLGRGDDGALGERLTRNALEALSATRPTHVLTIKGDVLDDRYWSAVDDAGSRHVLWLYDELRRTAHTDASLRRPHAVASYSPLDVADLLARGIRAHEVPLAFDPAFPFRRTTPTGEVSFIGARYPNRERTLVALRGAGVPVRAYGRDWSHHLVDRARTWTLGRPDLPSGRDVGRNEAYGIMASSLATLNIHGDQDGFTMRTFEAGGSGALQLIDRADVGVHYEVGTEILPYGDVAELLDHLGRARREPQWADAIRAAGRRRTLADHTFVERAQRLAALWD